MSQSQREELIKGFTEIACKVMPEVPKNAFYVFIKDHLNGKIDVEGLLLPDYLAELHNR